MTTDKAASRLTLVSGKGGVGKSAVATGMALYAHRRGQRVLVVDVAGAGGLAAHLGVGRLDFKAREVRPGLSALSIDRTKALAEYVNVQIGVPQIATLGPLARAFDALASTAPGVREVITLGKVLWEVRPGDYDLVVADCPPTGQITGLLRAPRTISELVPSGRVRQQAEWMGRLLSREKTDLVLVTLAEELPTIETQETMVLLAAENVVGPPTIVTNRVLPRLESDAKGSGVAAEAALLHRSLSRNQQDWIKRLPPDRELPYLFGLLTPGEVAARLADAWEHSEMAKK